MAGMKNLRCERGLGFSRPSHPSVPPLANPLTGSRGNDVFAGFAADFAKFIGSETEKWAKVVKFANIKAA
jgi:hypothetical protein